jgi:hypothetical protein
MKRLLSLIAILLIFPLTAQAIDYYVDKTHINANDSNAGTNPALPWTTIGKCASTIVAGDTCNVAGNGTYDEDVTETSDGTSGARIVYRATGSPVAKVRSFTLTGSDYVTLENFEITGVGMTSSNYGVIISQTPTSTGVYLHNLNIHHLNGAAGYVIGSAANLHIDGGSVSYLDNDCQPQMVAQNCTADAVVEFFGASPVATNVLIENVHFHHVLDYIHPSGSRWVVRNSTFGPSDPATDIHVDIIQNNSATEFILLENVLSYDNNSSDNHVILNSAPASHYIQRFTRTWLANGDGRWGSPFTTTDRGWAFYNNTYYDNFAVQGGTLCCQTNIFSLDTLARNNIFYKSIRPTGAVYPLTHLGAMDGDYDLRFGQNDPVQLHGVNADPLFVDAVNGNFNLQSTSPAINAGGPLTLSTGIGSNSTSLSVLKAYPLQDGWAGVIPDCIAVGTVTNVACISSINYTTNVITLATPLTWGAGASVWLYSKSDGVVVLNGSAPDIGAFEFGTPGPNITSLSVTSGLLGATVTITGANFGASQGLSAVAFNGTAAVVTAWSATSITTTVPAGATTGNVVVTVSGQPSNGVNFTVTTVAPSITTQPASITIANGASTTLTVAASGTAPFAYQWYQGTSGTTTTPVGTNSASFTTPGLTSTTSYWVRVSNGTAPNADSATATVTVNPVPVAPSITTQPAAITIANGASTTLTVAASGTAPFTYQWYQGSSGITTTPVGTDSASFTTPGLTSTTSYWVRVSNGTLPNADSATATVTVNPAPVAPSITTQPASITIANGASTTLNVAASGTAPFTYQWYQGNSGITTTPVGTDSASFTTPALTSTTSYWVRVSNGTLPNADSATATVTVNPAPVAPSITTQPASITIANAASTTLSVVASGTAPFTYQWYQGNSGITTTPVGTDSASFTTPALTSTTSYWVRVSNGTLPNADSATATVTVNPAPVAPSITTQPASITIVTGATTTLTVAATGTATLTYQWYQGASGTTTTPVGTNSNSFTTPALVATTSYWVRVSNGTSPDADSSTATVTVTLSDTTAPTPGNSGLIQISGITTSGMNLLWSSATDNVSLQTAIQYEVRRSTSNNINTVANAEANGTIAQAYATNLLAATIAGLNHSTTYFFNVIAKDEAGNKAVYAVQTATTLAAPDTTAPTTSITSPANGTPVTGSVTISATASDNVGIKGVAFFVDGVALGSQVLTPPYSVVWNTTTLPDGNHTLTVTAEDLAGNTGSSAITVLVANLSTTYEVPPNGGQSVDVEGESDPDVGVSHAKIVTSGGNTPTGVALISYSTGGQSSLVQTGAGTKFAQTTPSVLVSETGLAAVAETTSGIVYVDLGGSLDTGIAIANQRQQNAVINYYFTNEAGVNVKQGSFTLEANKQIAAFVSGAPFHAPNPLRGTLTLTSSVPVAATGMRILINERGEFLMSNLPVFSTSPSSDQLIPFFVDGAGWSSQIVLTNPSEETLTGTVQFYGSGSPGVEAVPMNLTVNGVAGTSFPYSIPPHSISRLATGGTSASALRSGSVKITPFIPNPFTGRVPHLLGVVSQRIGNVTVSETSVLADPTGYAFRSYVEYSGPATAQGQTVSTLAVTNTTSIQGSLVFDLTTLDGTPVGSPQSLALPAYGTVAKFVSDIFPGLPNNFRGILKISSTTPVGLLSLRARYNSRGEFLMATVPTVNEAAPPSQAVAFPHIVSGAGFATEIILLGAPGSTGRGRVSFTTQTGTPTSGASTVAP